MTQAEVNWRELVKGDLVKVEFEATVGQQGNGLYFNLAGCDPHLLLTPAELDAAKITRIERPWKVGDRFRRPGNTEWEVTGPARAKSNGGLEWPCWCDGVGYVGFNLNDRDIQRLEPSDDR